MQLDELGLNRYVYRDMNDNPTDSSLSASNQNTTNLGAGSGNASGTSNGVASAIAPGSIVYSVLLQTSPGPDRVELNPDDSLYAYNNNNIILTIDKNGISVGVANITTNTVGTLNVTTMLNYAGEPQPVMYTGIVDGAGNMTFGPVGWTSARLLVGYYRITHNLGLPPPGMKGFIQGRAGFYIADYLETDPNYFDVLLVDDTGVAVDGAFNFLALRYLP